jgi:hypothetical protein
MNGPDTLYAVRAVAERLAKDELRYSQSFWSLRARAFDEVCDLLGIEHHAADDSAPAKASEP